MHLSYSSKVLFIELKSSKVLSLTQFYSGFHPGMFVEGIPA